MEIINNKNYNKWRKFSLVVTDEDEYYADEILHIFLEKLMKKLEATPDFDVTDNYVFKSLKNTLLNMLKKEDRDNKKNKRYDTNVDSYDHEVDADDKLKKAAIEQVALSLEDADKDLFVIHFDMGKTQRHIAREMTEMD